MLDVGISRCLILVGYPGLTFEDWTCRLWVHLSACVGLRLLRDSILLKSATYQLSPLER